MKKRKIRWICTSSFLIAILLIATFFSMTVFEKEPCACVTMNQSVVWALNSIEKLVHEYAAMHKGHFPTYTEFKDLVGTNFRAGTVRITNMVDFSTRNFTFTPQAGLQGKIGYSVNSTKADYVLIGVGQTERYRDFRLFGSGFTVHTGDSFPVLHPGMEDPGPSPIN